MLSESRWFVEHLASTLRLGPTPAVRVEEWRVIARDELDRLCLRVTGGGPELSVTYGGELLSTGDEVELELPRTLRPGDGHAVRLVVPVRPDLGSHLQTLATTCRKLRLRTCFGPAGGPARVIRVVGGRPGRCTTGECSGPAADLPVDGAGEVVTDFREPEPGLPYGFRWT